MEHSTADRCVVRDFDRAGCAVEMDVDFHRSLVDAMMLTKSSFGRIQWVVNIFHNHSCKEVAVNHGVGRPSNQACKAPLHSPCQARQRMAQLPHLPCSGNPFLPFLVHYPCTLASHENRLTWGLTGSASQCYSAALPDPRYGGATQPYRAWCLFFELPIAQQQNLGHQCRHLCTFQ